MKKIFKIIIIIIIFFGLLLIVPVNADTNIGKYKYIVNYYKDSIKEDSLITSVEKEAIYNSVINIDTSYLLPEGYMYNNGEISFLLNSNKEINIVYKRKTNLNYCVNYFYDGIIFIHNTECFYNVEYGTKIDKFIEKEIEGYIFDYFEPITVLDIEENIMNVFYKSVNAKEISINYDNIEVDTDKIIEFFKTGINLLKKYIYLIKNI